MKLHNRSPVEGTVPPLYIGHRQYRDRNGNLKVSSKWFCEYNLDGQKFAEPLKTPNKAAAIRAAHVVAQRIERGESRHVQKRIDWDDLIRRYIEFLTNKERAPKTIEKYQYVLGEMVAFARSKGKSPLSFTNEDFWAFNLFMKDSGLGKKTRCDRLIIVKQLFKWAVQKAKPKLLRTNPVEGEEVPDVDPTPQPCFLPAQVEILLAEADPNERVIYAVMAYTGMRFGEVRDLQWDDFLFQHGGHGWITVRRGGSNNSTKGKRSRRIPIHAELRVLLDGLERRNGHVFSPRPSKKHPNGDGRIDERRLLRSLKRLCKRCGFSNPQQYKLHTFRHVFASMLARSQVSYKYALEFMGHKSSDILDLYYKMFDGDAEAAISTITYKLQDVRKAS